MLTVSIVVSKDFFRGQRMKWSSEMTKDEARQRVAREGGLETRKYLETYHMMAFLGVSEGSLKQLNREGLPHGKIGRRNIYDRMQVEAWASSNFFWTKA
jgi:hypothetical protein